MFLWLKYYSSFWNETLKGLLFSSDRASRQWESGSMSPWELWYLYSLGCLQLSALHILCRVSPSALRGFSKPCIAMQAEREVRVRGKLDGSTARQRLFTHHYRQQTSPRSKCW